MKADQLSARLTAFLERETGARVSVSDARSMTGGAVRDAWRVDAQLERPDGRKENQQLVLLLFRHGGPRTLSARDEFHLLEALWRAGAPVPRPLYFDEEALGRPFYAMERVAGETIGRKIVRDERFAAARRALPAELARALAAIHRVPIGEGQLPFLPGPEPGRPIAAGEVDRLEMLYRQIAVEAHPAFEIALRWLRAHAPRASRLALVHGDFRLGNLVVDETGLRAVLDWELAHRGDPLEDLAWVCVRSWRFGMDHLPLGGIAEREALFTAYENATGDLLDREALRFWEVYGNLRWGVFTLIQVRGFLEGISSSVELASIGRRTAETEWELLNLIEGRAF